MAGRIYARADILRPSERLPEAWDVIEVKCGTKLKDVYLQDIAFQKYCYGQAGICIDRCFLMHVNNEYERQGDIDVDGFFTLLDVSIEIIPFLGPIPKFVEEFLRIIDLPMCPERSIREHCSAPYECQMKPLCWAFLPESNVLELYRGKAKGFDLLDQNIKTLKEIPDSFKLTDNQHIQRQCAIEDRDHIDQQAIADFLKALTYPIYFMDFETIFEVIPRFDGVRPYQQIPFQFSVHIQRTYESSVEHFGFIHKNADDPRHDFIKELRAIVGVEGTVLVYNQSFEEGRLKELAEIFPKHADWCKDVSSKMVDLLVPFRKFYYYHPKQKGSASIKNVLPALVGSGYEGMEISDGGQASAEYVRVTYGEGVSSKEKHRIYNALDSYCKLDTKAMVDILGALKLITGQD